LDIFYRVLDKRYLLRWHSVKGLRNVTQHHRPNASLSIDDCMWLLKLTEIGLYIIPHGQRLSAATKSRGVTLSQ